MIKKILTTFLLCLTLSAHADSVLVYNLSRHKVEMSRNADQVRSIASITKIMTAMITLDYDIDLSRRLILSKRVHSYLPRQMYTREQLLKAMLIKSDNAAAETLAEDYPGGRSAFVARMNHQARLWDMKRTSFVDPSGLGVFNTSTARDLSELMIVAMGYPLIREVSAQKHVALETKNQKKIRKINLDHTSGPLLLAFDSVLISKTGLTSAAGWCVSMVVEQNKQQYIVIVLGSKNKKQRLDTVKEIRHGHALGTNLSDFKISATY
jgi:D-alanyl-D-alanine endopeptidase (penicillin-binding protein 7)